MIWPSVKNEERYYFDHGWDWSQSDSYSEWVDEQIRIEDLDQSRAR